MDFLQLQQLRKPTDTGFTGTLIWRGTIVIRHTAPWPACRLTYDVTTTPAV
jgi:hypothetical protein